MRTCCMLTPPSLAEALSLNHSNAGHRCCMHAVANDAGATCAIIYTMIPNHDEGTMPSHMSVCTPYCTPNHDDRMPTAHLPGGRVTAPTETAGSYAQLRARLLKVRRPPAGGPSPVGTACAQMRPRAAAPATAPQMTSLALSKAHIHTVTLSGRGGRGT